MISSDLMAMNGKAPTTVGRVLGAAASLLMRGTERGGRWQFFFSQIMSIDSQLTRKLSTWMVAGLLQLCMGMAVAQPLPAPSLALNFDALAQGQLPLGVSIKTQFPAPDVVPGVIGSAWRTDGFSSYAEANLSLDPTSGFSLAMWVALESYPSDLEVPLNELTPSSFAQQRAGAAGFDLYIDTYGRWGFKVATAQGEMRVAAPNRFPLQRWTQIVVSVNPEAGTVVLYQDGVKVGAASGASGQRLQLAAVPLRLARAPVEVKILDFTVNRLNAAYDLVEVYGSPLNELQVKALPGPANGQRPDAAASLAVPGSRFADDHLRPLVHPMPAANWTNEPHGLIRVGNLWHLFFQRTPNGPYKTLMHWGHMSSRDLVTWTQLPDALWPELQTENFGYDMKGIWSGHVIADGGKAFAFYTSVNHGDRLAASNPGIAMAVSEDPELRTWRKLGPILNSSGVKDFRDPFLWKEGDTWHMIVGAALETGGGLEYFVLKPGAEGAKWQKQTRFVEPSYRALDIGSEIWEMPVFEQLSDKVWVLLANPMGGRIGKYSEQATRAVYWTGEWSGESFKPYSRTPRNLDLVPGHLAPTVARAADGSLRAVGIIDERRSPAAQQRAGWAHTFSLPRVWSLMPDQKTLGQAPAPELTALRAPPVLANAAMALTAEPVVLATGLQALELQVDLDPRAPLPSLVWIDVLASADGKEFTRLAFNPLQGSVTVDTSHATLNADSEGPQTLSGEYDAHAFGAMLRLRVIVDGSAIEAFVNDAAAYAIRSYPSRKASTQVRISVPGAQPAAAGVQVWPLRRPSG